MTITEPSLNGHATPPPPPPPPPAPTVAEDGPSIVDRGKKALPTSRRAKQMVYAAGALGLVWVGLNRLNRPVEVGFNPAGVAQMIDQRVDARLANQAPTIVRTGPMSWVACPPDANALAMVGADAQQATAFDPARAAKVEDQVKALLAAGSRVGNLRVMVDPQDLSRGVSASQANLVVKDGGTDGVPLFNCSVATTTTQPATATSPAPAK